MIKKKIPVTIICGFLGSGKTTLLNHILHYNQNKKIAVIVNEFGEINVDSKLVKHTSEKMIELSNGCICCTLRGDLIEGVADLISNHHVDQILIESTGIGEPVPIAQAFYVHPELLALKPELPSIQSKVYVDAIITVVDSAQFLEMYNRNSIIPEDQFNRGYGQMLAEQIEGADIIILNKRDVATPEQMVTLSELFMSMNPRAKIIEAEQGKVHVTDIINTDIFDIEVAEQSSLWIAELEKKGTSEADEYGIETFAYTSARRFNEARLMELLDQGLPDNILRSKGIIALEGTDDAFLWSHAGKFLEFSKIGRFTSKEEVRTEIVFIGQRLDKRMLNQFFHKALCMEDHLLF